MVRCGGMKRMIHRTTFALDSETLGRLRRLSKAWRVSQAAVVRRAIAAADEAAIDRDIPLATSNVANFARFTDFGLRLLPG